MLEVLEICRSTDIFVATTIFVAFFFVGIIFLFTSALKAF